MVNGNYHAFWSRGQTCADLGPVAYPPIKLNNAGTLLGVWGVTWSWGAGMSMPNLINLDLPATADMMSINDSGAMVGSMAGGPGDIAILFEGNSVTDLNTQITAPGWLLTEAYAINNVGQIAGAGYLNGVNMGFLLDPITYNRFTPKSPVDHLFPGGPVGHLGRRDERRRRIGDPGRQRRQSAALWSAGRNLRRHNRSGCKLAVWIYDG